MEELIGYADIGRMLGVSRQRARQIAGEYDDFPAPAALVQRQPAWRPKDIEKWMARHPERRPGRPKKEQ